MRGLLAPRWLVAHLVVLTVCTGCVVAGFWQIQRLEDRRTANAVHAARYREDPLPVGELVKLSGGDVESLEYRRAAATGTFLPDEEVLVRSQVLEGRAGFDVITPLLLADDTAVAVNRGWVPLEFDAPPVTAAPPPAGTVTVQGVVRLSQPRSAFSPADVTEMRTVSRVDVGVLDRLISEDLLPVYLEQVGAPDPITLPVPAPEPEFGDEGPHLSYAIQWFSFAAVGVIGYGFLLRREIRRSSGGDRETGNHVDAGKAGQITSR